MNLLGRALVVIPAAITLLPLCGLSSHSIPSNCPDFIVTVAPVYKPLAEFQGQERFPNGAQMLLVHDGKAEPLVPGFAATADADVSFDGKFVLFAGKKSASDSWQIWELTLQDRSVRKVIETAGDAERPLNLPGGRLLWAQRTAYGFQIESADDGHLPRPVFLNPTAGAGILALTYLHTSAFPADVLADGRILFESNFPLGEGSTPELYTVYADGSGVESYRCDHGRGRWGGMQLASGDVVFTHGASLARFTSPLAHEEPVAAPAAEYAGGIAETASRNWLLSARTIGGAHYGIHLWDPSFAAKTRSTKLETVLEISGMNLVEPVLIAPRSRPNRHPSGLHPWDYANLLALDARHSRDGDLKAAPPSVRLEVQNERGVVAAMGTAPVERDGSFFVKVPADIPIRFALLDEEGSVVRREQGWFWIRKGEQRICVGCHTGPERASENLVPAVLLHTTSPVDLTGAAAGPKATAAAGGN
jgi:hypothetical protein